MKLFKNGMTTFNGKLF